MGKAEEAGHDTIVDNIAPPPAYSEAGAPTTSQSQEESVTRSDIKPTSQINQQFPPHFNAYYQWKFTKTFHLGQSKDQPLYAVRTHTGWSGTPGIVLHNGPSDKDPPLAAAGDENSWSKHSTIILPPLPGSDAKSSTEFMRTNVSWKTVSYPFTIEVGHGPNARRENFEWRQSRGGEIKELDKHSRGWKLVRLRANAEGSGGERSARSHGATSDGKEIVAVWTWHSGWSMTKSFKFQFLGSALTGEMGERWSVMAVITALRMWYLHFAGVSSSGAANGVTVVTG
ncbi:hypothetical protein SCAR479_11305 [Seiridium cardinale]|uniref:Uncharacterized protein n=1 Tax=Seiridium cardinale TaxID=138064 RepID=A0ABR2XEF6_9PEZI